MGALSHDEVLSVMGRSRAIVIPSVCRETFGLVAYEAMIAAGLPCIVSDVGDAASFVRSKASAKFSARAVPSRYLTQWSICLTLMFVLVIGKRLRRRTSAALKRPHMLNVL